MDSKILTRTFLVAIKNKQKIFKKLGKMYNMKGTNIFFQSFEIDIKFSQQGTQFFLYLIPILIN